jgi:geranylgeranyl pyrophosphate synthase
MATTISPSELPVDDIKRVPQDTGTRQAIRSAAAELAIGLDQSHPPTREDLERAGQSVLARLELPRRFLGFAMVAVSNTYWRPLMAATPFQRRLFLLPHCLSNQSVCAGSYDSVGLHCAGCGGCEIQALKAQAEQLGYAVIVAEGTSSLFLQVLEGDVDAIFGVACLDSLEKSFSHLVDLGVAHVAVPLLKDGCRDTEAEIDLIRELLLAEAAPSLAAPRSYVPLLRETARMFQPPQIADLLAPYLESAEPREKGDSPRPTFGRCPSERPDECFAQKGTVPFFPPSVEDIALEWLREGGKRLRPFVTIAAYAVARYGMAILDGGGEIHARIPLPVWRLALAIEALHKASLVHDDIEDDDEFRYGHPTLHRQYGVAPAVNVGDFLIGLGYRLIAGEMATLGTACGTDILNQLSHAHLELCRGQGAELQLAGRPAEVLEAAEVMKVYAQKTAPAFEVALYSGLRAAGQTMDFTILRRFATYLGEGFQIKNDLDDWRQDDRNKRNRGLDVLAGRPTMLRVFAARSVYAADLAELAQSNGRFPPAERVERFRELYCRSGAFSQTDQLYQKLRDRALAAADQFPTADLRELMRFLVRMVLRELPDPQAMVS